MFKIVKKEIVWGGKKLSIESGKIARQAGMAGTSKVFVEIPFTNGYIFP